MLLRVAAHLATSYYPKRGFRPSNQPIMPIERVCLSQREALRIGILKIKRAMKAASDTSQAHADASRREEDGGAGCATSVIAAKNVQRAYMADKLTTRRGRMRGNGNHSIKPAACSFEGVLRRNIGNVQPLICSGEHIVESASWRDWAGEGCVRHLSCCKNRHRLLRYVGDSAMLHL